MMGITYYLDFWLGLNIEFSFKQESVFVNELQIRRRNHLTLTKINFLTISNIFHTLNLTFNQVLLFFDKLIKLSPTGTPGTFFWLWTTTHNEFTYYLKEFQLSWYSWIGVIDEISSFFHLFFIFLNEN